MSCRCCSLIDPSTAHYTLSAPLVQGVAREMLPVGWRKGGGDHKPFTVQARGRRVFGWRERVAMIASLSRPMPVAGTSLEALSLLRSIPLPLVRARGAHGKTASHQPKAKPFKNHSREKPRLSRPSPASRSSSCGPATNGKAIASPLACAEQFCRARPVRAPKAEHWLSTWPSASKNGAATGSVRERIVLPLTFHTKWLSLPRASLRLSGRGCRARRPQRPSRSRRTRSGPSPA